MSLLLPIVILVLVGAVLYWAVLKILAAFGIGDPIATVVQVLLVILLLVVFLDAIGVTRLGLAPVSLR